MLSPTSLTSTHLITRSARETITQPSSWSEPELLERMLVNSPTAWREFSGRYTRLVMSCIQRVLSRFSRRFGADAQEEIYATFSLSLLANDKRKLRGFEPERGNKLGTWLGMLATHAAYDYLRRQRREPNPVCLSEAETLGSEERDPCEETLIKERAAFVQAQLSGLSDKDREFVALYYGEGLSPEQVAEQLQISVKTVYSKKHKIQRRLTAIASEPSRAA